MKLKDGYYIEVKNSGEKSGIKIRRESKEQIKQTLEIYNRTKEVTYLGEFKKGKLVSSKL